MGSIHARWLWFGMALGRYRNFRAAVPNALFAIWQKTTGNGWVNGDFARNVNAFWPDLHSFGAFMALALFLGFGALYTCTLRRKSKIAIGVWHCSPL